MNQMKPKAYPRNSNLHYIAGILLNFLLPLGAVVSSVSLVVHVLNSADSPAMPFWMVLAGALMFGFGPLLLRNFYKLLSLRQKRDLMHWYD